MNPAPPVVMPFLDPDIQPQDDLQIEVEEELVQQPQVQNNVAGGQPVDPKKILSIAGLRAAYANIIGNERLPNAPFTYMGAAEDIIIKLFEALRLGDPDIFLDVNKHRKIGETYEWRKNQVRGMVNTVAPEALEYIKDVYLGKPSSWEKLETRYPYFGARQIQYGMTEAAYGVGLNLLFPGIGIVYTPTILAKRAYDTLGRRRAELVQIRDEDRKTLAGKLYTGSLIRGYDLLRIATAPVGLPARVVGDVMNFASNAAFSFGVDFMQGNAWPNKILVKMAALSKDGSEAGDSEAGKLVKWMFKGIDMVGNFAKKLGPENSKELEKAVKADTGKEEKK